MKHFEIKLGADKAVAILQETALAIPMGVVSHINGQANCAKKGITVPADQILEIFRPDFAIKVWNAEKSAGIDIPLRIHVYEFGGKTHVTFRTPEEVFLPYNNPELMKTAEELTPIFDQILASLDPYRI